MSSRLLDGAFERVNRAGEHLVDLGQTIADFTQAYHDAVIVQFEPNPPHKIVFDSPKLFSHPSPRIGILVGEICYNLRAALDYLVYELARLDSGVIQDGTQFPIQNTAQDFRQRCRTFLKEVNPSHVAAIERLQPYNGCRWTKVLADICNPDKHRQISATNYGGFVTIDRPGFTLPQTHVPQIRSIRRALRFDGIEVDVQLITSIAVQIPLEKTLGLPAAFSAEGTLQELKAEVARLLEAFKPEFK